MFDEVQSNPAHHLRCQLVAKFPKALINLFPSTEEENATFKDPENHPWFLGVYIDEKEVAVEWNQKKGFHIRMFISDRNHEKPTINCLAAECESALSTIEDFLGKQH